VTPVYQTIPAVLRHTPAAEQAAITAVRERTSVGYLDALHALREHGWRVDAAVDYLRRHVVRCA
jgi:translation elongation factor EF-Ts